MEIDEISPVGVCCQLYELCHSEVLFGMR